MLLVGCTLESCKLNFSVPQYFKLCFCEPLPRRVFVFHHPLLFICMQETSSYYVRNTQTVSLNFPPKVLHLSFQQHFNVRSFIQLLCTFAKIPLCGPLLTISMSSSEAWGKLFIFNSAELNS